MQFGKARDIRHLDLSLPPDDPGTARVLRSAAPPRAAALDARLGLPVWNNDLMAEILCPPGTPKARRLACYARRFAAVELNASGYGLVPEHARAWAEATPGGFRFYPKVPRDVSHSPDLSRTGPAFAAFAEAARAFGDRLGTTLIQFPESFGPRRFRELEAFLKAHGRRLPLAVEVRAREWFVQRGPREALFGLLEDLGLVAAITDAPARRDAAHMRLTAPEAYVRFCGHDRSGKDRARMEEWVERILAWRAMGLQRLHLFLHHEPEHVSVAWAADFAEALNRAAGTAIPVPPTEPQAVPASPQLDLFA